MASWSWVFTEQAEEDIAKLDRPVRRRILDRLDWFAENFEDTAPLSLGGDYKQFYKIRVGDWRILYKIDWAEYRIIVVYIDHPKESLQKENITQQPRSRKAARFVCITQTTKRKPNLKLHNGFARAEDCSRSVV